MHLRRTTWALIAWTALMAIWLLASASATATGCAETGGSTGDCNANVGFAIAIVVFVWFLVFVPLIAAWYAGRRGIPTREARWPNPDEAPTNRG